MTSFVKISATFSFVSILCIFISLNITLSLTERRSLCASFIGEALDLLLLLRKNYL